jgi:ribonuclease P protein component
LNSLKYHQSSKFPPAARIKNRSEFVKLQNVGKRFFTKSFLVITVDQDKDFLAYHERTTVSRRISFEGSSFKDPFNRDKTFSRLGIIITKKVAKSSVKRNRVKRLVREVYRRYYKSFKKDVNMLIIARFGVKTLNYQTAESELLFIWSKIKLL